MLGTTPKVKDRQSSDTAPPESISTPASIPVVQKGSGEEIAERLTDQESSGEPAEAAEKKQPPASDRSTDIEGQSAIITDDDKLGDTPSEKTDEDEFAETFKKCSYISDIINDFLASNDFKNWISGDITTPLSEFSELWGKICKSGNMGSFSEDDLKKGAENLQQAIGNMKELEIKNQTDETSELILREYTHFRQKLEAFFNFITSGGVSLIVDSSIIDDDDDSSDAIIRSLNIDDLKEIISFSSVLNQNMDSLVETFKSTKDINKIFSTKAPTSKEATANEEIIEQMQEKDWLDGDKVPFNLKHVCSVNGFTELQEKFTKIINSISATSVQAKKDHAKSLLKFDIDEIDKKKVTSAQLKMLTKQISNALNELNRYQGDSVNDIANLISKIPDKKDEAKNFDYSQSDPYDLQKTQKFIDAVEDAVRDALYALVNSDIFSEIPEDIIEPLKSMTGYLHIPEDEQKWKLLNPNRIWLWIQKQNFEKASEYDRAAAYRTEIEQMLSSYANAKRESKLRDDLDYAKLIELKEKLYENFEDADFVDHLMSYDRFGRGNSLSLERKSKKLKNEAQPQRFNVTDTTCISRICGAIALGFSNKNIPAEIKSEFKAFHLNETSSPFYKDLSEVTSPTFNGLPTNLYSKLIAFTKSLNKLLPDKKAQETKDEKDKPIITESAKINAARELISIITDFANRGELTNSYQLSKAVSALAPSFGFKLEKFKAKKEEYDFATRIDIIS